MRCTIYNGHPDYRIGGIRALVKSLECYVPIHYDALSVAFLTEPDLCSIHKRFLRDPSPTDVITFPADPEDPEQVGEICISIDEALKYAELSSLADELTLYLVHGWLHLAHYTDQTEQEQWQMRQMEQRALGFLNQQAVKLVRVQRVYNR